jgi:hypothetical protein
LNGTTGPAGAVGVAGTLSGLVAFDGFATAITSAGTGTIESVVVPLATVVASEPTSYYLREFSAIAGSTPRSIHLVGFAATYVDEYELWTVNAGVSYYDPNDSNSTSITVSGYYKL